MPGQRETEDARRMDRLRKEEGVCVCQGRSQRGIVRHVGEEEGVGVQDMSTGLRNQRLNKSP